MSDEYRDVRMDLMSSRDVQGYMQENDMAILPVGCFEMHGPDMPLATDSYHAWAQAVLLAKEWRCLVLPPVMYTFPGGSGPWPGTVNISTRITMEYIKEIVMGLIKAGFKRIVLCGTHGPLKSILYCVMEDIFLETNTVITHIIPPLMPDDLMQEKLGYLRGEDILLAASLKILGLHGAYDPAAREDRPQEFPLPSIKKLKEAKAEVSWTFSRDYQHTGLRKQVTLDDVDTAVEIMKEAAKRIKDFPEHFAQYQKEMKELWTKAPWKDRNTWTQTR
jgi:creatinine amidohydrolase/Fe(II)-dependent formamide hydrolase-like protein